VVFDIYIQPNENVVAIPLGRTDEFQMRSDGVVINSKLYFWEGIKSVYIKVVPEEKADAEGTVRVYWKL
jgi:hypothetical protein